MSTVKKLILKTQDYDEVAVQKIMNHSVFRDLKQLQERASIGKIKVACEIEAIDFKGDELTTGNLSEGDVLGRPHVKFQRAMGD